MKRRCQIVRFEIWLDEGKDPVDFSELVHNNPDVFKHIEDGDMSITQRGNRTVF